MIIPIIILMILSCISLGVTIGKHGKSQGNYNGWAALISLLLQWGLIIWIILSK